MAKWQQLVSLAASPMHQSMPHFHCLTAKYIKSITSPIDWIRYRLSTWMIQIRVRVFLIVFEFVLPRNLIAIGHLPDFWAALSLAAIWHAPGNFKLSMSNTDMPGDLFRIWCAIWGTVRFVANVEFKVRQLAVMQPSLSPWVMAGCGTQGEEL